MSSNNLVKFPVKSKANTLVNWAHVCRVDRHGEGTMIFFLDGSKHKSDRTFEDVERLVKKYWAR